MLYFLIVLFALGDIFFLWWGDRRLRPLRKSKTWRTLLAALIGAQFLMLVWWTLFPGTLRGLGSGFWKPVSAWLYMWHLLVLPATLIALGFGYLILGLGRLFTRLVMALPNTAPAAGAAATAIAPTPAKTDEPVFGTVTGPAVVYPSRRQILAAAAAFAPQAALGGTLLLSASQTGKFRIRRMEVSLPTLPPALDGVTLAHVSDTHVGRFVGSHELEAIVAATAGLKPDLVVFTGDLIDFNLADLPPAIAAMRELAKVAPLAMCVGNHDLFEDGRQFRRRIRAADLNLVANDVMPVTLRGQRIDLLGLDWGTPAAPRAAEIEPHMRDLLARHAGGGGFPILLAHHPHAFDPARAAGIPLTLSGHTHGGQIMLTPHFGCGCVYKYYSGLYSKGTSRLVVSNGVGNWFPLRINAPAEIIHLTLRKA
jgi:predicted MPP superfamily phosphohydrolase